MHFKIHRGTKKMAVRVLKSGLKSLKSSRLDKIVT